MLSGRIIAVRYGTSRFRKHQWAQAWAASVAKPRPHTAGFSTHPISVSSNCGHYLLQTGAPEESATAARHDREQSRPAVRPLAFARFEALDRPLSGKRAHEARDLRLGVKGDDLVEAADPQLAQSQPFGLDHHTNSLRPLALTTFKFKARVWMAATAAPCDGRKRSSQVAAPDLTPAARVRRSRLSPSKLGSPARPAASGQARRAPGARRESRPRRPPPPPADARDRHRRRWR